MKPLSLQETYAAKSICFGCGPANTKGLQIKSFVDGDEVIAEFQALNEHQAFPGVLNGGIIGSLLDCHCNWAAAHYLMQANELKEPPCTVTAEYHIYLKRPTPIDETIYLRAKLIELKSDRATIAGELISHGKICATCTGTFVSVKSDHPAFHRW